MPCFNVERPAACPAPAGEVDIFANDGDDDGNGDWDEEWKRKKREAPEARERRETAGQWRKGTKPGEDVVAKVDAFRGPHDYMSMWLPKMEYLMSRCVGLHYTTPHCTTLQCTAPHCTSLHCTAGTKRAR
jgi:hypothetical protein